MLAVLFVINLYLVVKWESTDLLGNSFLFLPSCDVDYFETSLINAYLYICSGHQLTLWYMSSMNSSHLLTTASAINATLYFL
jgi:hypothetical protein